METFNLPQDYRPFVDKYFLRAKEILQKENLNPVIKAQVFIRKGNCTLYGINEAITIITKYGKVNNLYALKEGTHFENGECLMTFEAPIRDVIDLETMYLGVLSTETTLKNGSNDIDLVSVQNNMENIVSLVGSRPVSYFGARHWRYDRDYDISKACFEAGAKSCSTDAGAKAWGENEKGVGTIPHALETIYHWKLGIESAVSESLMAFNRHMPPEIPRIALVDYRNRELIDSFYIVIEKSAHGKLDGIRIDTCGENVMEGALPSITEHYFPYWYGTGVTISGVYNIRKILNNSGYQDVKIMLSSGFGNPEKVKAFVDAEQQLGIKLFDGLGVGGVFDSRMATMDIIQVDGKDIHKAGRMPKDTSKLVQVI